MRVREAEVAAERAYAPNANVGHATLHLCERRKEAVDEGRGLQRAVRHRGPDVQRAVSLLEHA